VVYFSASGADASLRKDEQDFLVTFAHHNRGEYAGLEHSAVAGVVESLKVTTRAKSERIARFAFDYALKNGRKVSKTPQYVLDLG
jgi:isocitrate dehydrogenase (NAD+)